MFSGDGTAVSRLSLSLSLSAAIQLKPSSHVTVTHAHTHLRTRFQFPCFLLQHLASAHSLIHVLLLMFLMYVSSGSSVEGWVEVDIINEAVTSIRVLSVCLPKRSGSQKQAKTREKRAGRQKTKVGWNVGRLEGMFVKRNGGSWGSKKEVRRMGV